jgi:hypothetical protein
MPRTILITMLVVACCGCASSRKVEPVPFECPDVEERVLFRMSSGAIIGADFEGRVVGRDSAGQAVAPKDLVSTERIRRARSGRW